MSEQPKRYHSILVTLHWLTVMLLLGIGLLADTDNLGSSPINIHMIIGIFLLIVMVSRLIVRYTTRRPTPADAGNAILNKIGEGVHFGLYLGIFFILGLGGLIANRRDLLGAVLYPDLAPASGSFRDLGEIHEMGWALLLGLIALHVGAALYHQFILKDNLLARMWYGK